MSREISLLSKIKSKYILKDLLSLAYYDINSIIKLVKYNKSLLNKLDINIKTIDKLNNYKLQTKKNIKIIKIRYFWIIIMIIFHPEGIGIILLLIYIIFFYKKGKFTDDILEKGYNERKKKFVDSMDKYLLIPYIWIIAILTLNLIRTFIIILFMLIKKINNFDDERIYILNQINGINIVNYELPLTFNDLNKNEKNKFIYKKENIEKYEYKLNKNQIILINKINDIRILNNIPILEYNKYNRLSNFILKEKAELFFNPNKNLYYYAALNIYIFKYPKNKFINMLNHKETLNIILNYRLSKITIIELNNLEYIYLYNNTNIIPPYNSN